MSDSSAFGFGKFVPGFDFLQNLSQTAAKATPAAGGVPGMSSWVAPTLSVEEIDKRIQELKAVQFWLEQNGTALKATIQALEVQKMTLTTLQGMNVNMAELAKAFTARAPETAAPAQTAPPEPAPQPQARPEPALEAQAKPKAKRAEKPQASTSEAAKAVDPMQWWGSLTQQFQNIATAAMQDAAAQAMQTKSAPPQKPASSKKPAGKAAPRKTAGQRPAASKTRRPRA